MKLDNLDQDVEGVHALHVHVEYVDKFLRDEQKPLLVHLHQFELGFPLTPSTVTLT